MSVINGTLQNFENEVLKSDKPVLVDFNAEWCGPCRMLAPVLHEIAESTDSFKVVAVNVDDESDLASEYGVSSIPCLVAFKDGAEVKRSVGLKPKGEILAMMGAL